MTTTEGIAGGRILSIIERIENLEEEIKALNEGKKEVFAEAKGEGYDIKVLREILKLRKLDNDERDEQESLLDLYMRAIADAEPQKKRRLNGAARRPRESAVRAWLSEAAQALHGRSASSSLTRSRNPARSSVTKSAAAGGSLAVGAWRWSIWPGLPVTITVVMPRARGTARFLAMSSNIAACAGSTPWARKKAS